MEVHRVDGTPSSLDQTVAAQKQVTRFELPELKNNKPSSPKSQAGKPGESPLTKAEQEYFVTAFPDRAGELRQHATYQRNGSRPQGVVGTVVDRKG